MNFLQCEITPLLYSASIVTIALFAAGEELVKVALVRGTRWLKNSWFSIYIFFSVELGLKLLDYFLRFPADQRIDFTVLANASGLVASTLFHIASSIYYKNTKRLWMAVCFCIVLHVVYNVLAEGCLDNREDVLLLGWSFVLIQCGVTLGLLGLEKWEKGASSIRL
jgi:predicted Abi (CAAX) family protease